MIGALIRSISQMYPQAFEAFETTITEMNMHEVMEGEEIDEMITELVSEEDGFPSNVEPQYLNYTFEALNNIPTEDFIELYLLEEVNVDDPLSMIISNDFTQEKINEYRLSHPEYLKFLLTIQDDPQTFLDNHPWFDLNHFANRMSDLYDPQIAIEMIENREMMSGEGRDTFLDRFYEAGQDALAPYDMGFEEIDYDSTPIKVTHFELLSDFGELAELFESRVQQHMSVQAFMESDFYHEIFEHQCVDYTLGVLIDPEDFGGE